MSEPLYTKGNVDANRKALLGAGNFFFFLQSLSPVLCCFEELSEGVYFYNLLDRNVFKMSLTGSCKPCLHPAPCRSLLVALLLTQPQQSWAPCCWWHAQCRLSSAGAAYQSRPLHAHNCMWPAHRAAGTCKQAPGKPPCTSMASVSSLSWSVALQIVYPIILTNPCA